MREESVREESMREECEGGECEERLTGAVAAVRLSCRPSSNPPLASLTRHTLLSDWSKSFNKYAHIHISNAI